MVLFEPIGARLLSAGGGGRGEDTDREGPPLHGPGHGHQAGGNQVREQGCRGRSVPKHDKSLSFPMPNHH
jgi:hypothetical protein